MSFTTQRSNYTQNELSMLDFYIDLHNETNDRIDYLYQVQNEIRGSINEIMRNRHYNSNRSSQLRQQEMRSDQMRSHLHTETVREPNYLGRYRYPSYFREDQNNSLRSHYLRGSSRTTPLNRGRNSRRNENPIFTTFIDSFYENVRVIPTLLQIQNATRQLPFSQIENPINTSCPISLERFENNSPVVEILHCHHLFHPESLHSWFSENVRCPVCRYDIRSYQSDARPVNPIPNPIPNPSPQQPQTRTQIDTNLNNSLLELTESLISQFMNSPTNLFDTPPEYHFDPSFNSFTITQFPLTRF